jgi:hypothetical protein
MANVSINKGMCLLGKEGKKQRVKGMEYGAWGMGHGIVKEWKKEK